MTNFTVLPFVFHAQTTNTIIYHMFLPRLVRWPVVHIIHVALRWPHSMYPSPQNCTFTFSFSHFYFFPNPGQLSLIAYPILWILFTPHIYCSQAQLLYDVYFFLQVFTFHASCSYNNVCSTTTPSHISYFYLHWFFFPFTQSPQNPVILCPQQCIISVVIHFTILRYIYTFIFEDPKQLTFLICLLSDIINQILLSFYLFIFGT